MQKVAVSAATALVMALSGCASVVEGTTENVAVTSPPVEGARCALENSQGTWYLTTPGNAQIHKTKTDLHVTCKKDGYRDASQIVEPHFNGATFGNVLAGGVIGAGVDAATGANYNYPTQLQVPMLTEAEAQKADDPRLAACGLKKVAEAPLSGHPDGSFALATTINTTPVPLLLDTSASATTVSPQMMHELNLSPRRLPSIDSGFSPPIGVGDTPAVVTVANIPSYSFVLYEQRPRNPDYDGGFATTMLDNNDLELDLGGARLAMFAPGHCSGGEAYWTSGPVAVVPFERLRYGQIAISVTLDGLPVRAILDSGADKSHLSQAVVTGTFGRGHRTFRTLALEGVQIGTPAIEVTDDNPDTQPYLFIGSDLMKKLRIFVAYKEKRLYVTDAGAR